MAGPFILPRRQNLGALTGFELGWNDKKDPLLEGPGSQDQGTSLCASYAFVARLQTIQLPADVFDGLSIPQLDEFIHTSALWLFDDVDPDLGDTLFYHVQVLGGAQREVQNPSRYERPPVVYAKF
jgi:hypothetical protein